MFIATAEPFDDEMRERIALHVAARGPRWRTIEAPYDLAAALRSGAHPGRVLLVDCLTLWLGNLMHRGDDPDAAGRDLAQTLGTLAGPVLLVSNEVGGGIVPETALARRFRDAQGQLNQRIAGTCDRVVLVTAGLARILKPSPRVNLSL